MRDKDAQAGAPAAAARTIGRRSIAVGLSAAGAALFARPARAKKPRPWPGGAQGAISLTYDDGLDSQLDHVIPELAARGLKATFFIVRENMEDRTADWVRVAEAGHEIGNHTASHPCTLAAFSEERFLHDELLPMEDFLDARFPRRPIHAFAYPCGYLGLGRGGEDRRLGRYRRALETVFAAARTTTGGPNDPARVQDNRLNLNALEPTYDGQAIGPAIRYLDQALAEGGWAIFVFHEVLPARVGEGDTSIALHRRILDEIASRKLWCAPMGEVFQHLTDWPSSGPIAS